MHLYRPIVRVSVTTASTQNFTNHVDSVGLSQVNGVKCSVNTEYFYALDCLRGRKKPFLGLLTFPIFFCFIILFRQFSVSFVQLAAQ